MTHFIIQMFSYSCYFKNYNTFICAINVKFKKSIEVNKLPIYYIILNINTSFSSRNQMNILPVISPLHRIIWNHWVWVRWSSTVNTT